MQKALWALTGLAILLIAGGIAIWSLLVPLVPGAAIKASCHEPLTQACIDQVRALGDDFAAKGNLAEAASWYGWAAKGGDKVAMFLLGGVNYARAVDDAARQGHADFVASEEGRRASVNELNGFPAATACGWFRRAADLGYAPAMNNVGECYLHGIGFTRSTLAAYQWHLAAAEAGNPVAAMNLIEDYKQSLSGKDETASVPVWTAKRFDQTNRPDLDDKILSYTLRGGAQISPEERDMMRQAGATIASVESAIAQANSGDACGLFDGCSSQPSASASPAAATPAQAVQ
jgi:TPR repeat protein